MYAQIFWDSRQMGRIGRQLPAGLVKQFRRPSARATRQVLRAKLDK
jgi:hypothetical protein